MNKFCWLFVILFSGTSNLASAASPTCHTAGGESYCRYQGPIRELYVNASGLMLFYFEEAMDASTAASVGYSIAYGSAGAVLLSANPEFAKLLYSTALAAQASGRSVTLQMRGTVAGYMNVDRIWLAE